MDERALKQRGKRARQRAQARAKTGRITAADWYPEIKRLVDSGISKSKIADIVDLSPRRVRDILEEGMEDASGTVRVVPNPIGWEKLEPHAREMVEFSGRGFKKFYEAYSGFELPSHCEEWVDLFCEHRNLMLNVPPRHMKSSIFSIWVPAWLLARNRDEQVLIVSKTKDFASKWAIGIAGILSDANVVRDFGRFSTETKGEHPWRPSKGELVVLGRTKVGAAQYSIESRGMEQQILGAEATVVICDDITDGKVSRSELAHAEEMRKLHEEILNRIQPAADGSASGRAVVVGQRVHWNDAYGDLANMKYVRGPDRGKPLWHVVKMPAVLRWPDEDPEEPEPEVLWPEVWPYDELMVTYERVGGHNAFMCMYQQDPIPEDSMIVSEDWLVQCRDYNRGGYDGLRLPAKKAILPVVRVLSIDPGDKRYYGLVVADVPQNKEQFYAAILEAKHWQGGLQAFRLEVLRAIEQHRPDYFVLEEHMGSRWFFQDPVYHEIKEKVRVLPHHTGVNKGDSELGVESLGGDFEFGRISTPYGDSIGREMTSLLEEEAKTWPYGDHDDVLMALWFVKWNWKKFKVKNVKKNFERLADKVANAMKPGTGPWAGFERSA